MLNAFFRNLPTLLCGLLLTFMSSTSAATGFVYALNDDVSGNNVYGFSVNESTGALTALPGFPVSTGGTGAAGNAATPKNASEQLFFDRRNSRLYALNAGSNTVSAFAVHPITGALTVLPFSPINLGAGSWYTLSVHPSGSPLLVGNGMGGSLLSFVIAPTTATAATGSPFTTGTASPFSIAFSRDGTYVYTGGNNDGNQFLAAYQVDAATGVLTALAGSPYDSGALYPVGFVTDAAGRLFTSSFNAGTLRAYTTAAGIPAPVTGNPFSLGAVVRPVHAVLHPAGYYLIADRANAVGSFAIGGSGSATTLTAVAGSPVASGGTFTDAIALNQAGTFVFAANGTSRNLSVLPINPATGALGTAVVQPADTLGTIGLLTGIAYAPPVLPGFVYVLNNNPAGNAIYGYVPNDTGALTPLPGFPVATGGTGSLINASEQLVLDRRNARLYAVNSGSNTVSAYAADPFTGDLKELPFSPINIGAGNWYTVGVHPSGSPVLVGDATGLQMVSLNVTSTSATPAAGSPFSLGGAAPFSIAFSRDGRFVYTGGNNDGNEFLAYLQVDRTTGVLTPLAGSPMFGELYPVALNTDASGRLYAAYFTSGQLRVFTTPGGIPTSVPGNPFMSTNILTRPAHGVLHPNGFYMVADRMGDRIGVFGINGVGTSTTLSNIAGSPFASGGTFTNALALNHKGTFLFATNSTSLNVSSFSVAANGALASAGTLPVNSAGTSGRLGGITFLAPPVDLLVTVVDTPDMVLAGSANGNLTYTVTLANKGVFDATSVQVTNTQTLPTGVTFVSATPSAGTFDNNTGIWSLPTLAAGASATLTITNTVSGTTASGADVITDTATVTAVTETLANPSAVTATQSTSVFSVIVSGPTAVPNPATVGQSITFSIVAAGTGITYDWTFGDGTAGSGDTVTHSYAASGTYNVSVAVKTDGNPPQTATVQVAIVNPLVGSGIDSDGDGFSDKFETAAGTDINSAASTPTGLPAAATPVQPLTVAKTMIKLNFASVLKDSIAFSGTVAIPAGFTVSGKKAVVDIGGVASGFTLDAKGASKTTAGTFKVTIKAKKGVVAAQTSKYSVSLKKGSFRGELADEQLTADADVKKQPRTVLFTLVFNNTILQKSQPLIYTARKGKTGMAK